MEHKDIVLAFFKQHYESLAYKDKLRDLLYIIFPKPRFYFDYKEHEIFRPIPFGNYLTDLLHAQGPLGEIVAENTRPFLEDLVEDLVDFADELYENLYTFKIEKETKTITFPDGSRKAMEQTDKRDEYYAEWRDIGVFYYPPLEHKWWSQGQKPTYLGEQELTDYVNVTFI